MTSRLARRRGSERRGSVIVIAIWAIAITAVIGASIQLFAYRQAMVSFDSLQRVQSRWAARAGLENTISMLALHTQQPIAEDARDIIRGLEGVSAGELRDSTYSILHHQNGFNINGPMDDHARVNINRPGVPYFELMEDLSPDQAAAIQDWIDDDDEPSMFGAESDYYLATIGVEPRNAPFRSIAELELVAGIWSDYLRNEDHNLNNRLDLNENDGDATLPEDLADGYLDAGWSQILSVYSFDNGSTLSGERRIHLRRAEEGELEDRCDIDAEQALRLKAFGRHYENTLMDLVTVPLSRINPDGTVAPDDVDDEIVVLTEEQIVAVIGETRVLPPHDRQAGRVNINTASMKLVEDLCEAAGFPVEVAQELIYLRSSSPTGIVNELAFREINGLSDGEFAMLVNLFCTRSNVFVVSTRGRSEVSGAETEIIAVVDRSTVPIRILEYREQ